LKFKSESIEHVAKSDVDKKIQNFDRQPKKLRSCLFSYEQARLSGFVQPRSAIKAYAGLTKNCETYAGLTTTRIFGSRIAEK